MIGFDDVVALFDKIEQSPPSPTISEVIETAERLAEDWRS